MTNGYTKIRGNNYGSSRTRSMGFPDDNTFSPLPPPPPPTREDVRRPTSPARSSKAPRNDADARPRGNFFPQEELAADGEKFGVILSRTCSFSTSHRFAATYERGNSGINAGASAGGGLHSAVRGAFSMRKLTSSPAEGYCRIHDITVDPSDVAQRDFREEHVRSSGKKAKKTTKEGRVLRACRKLFGF